MKFQKAIVRQSIAIIEKQVIITLSTCRVATLKDGPDLSVFWNPLTLAKLAQFLIYAIRVRSAVFLFGCMMSTAPCLIKFVFCALYVG